MTSDILLPWVHSAGGDGERKSIQTFQGDGTTTLWEFNFAGGYIDPTHVKAYRYDPVSATSHPQVLTFIGQNQIKTSEPIPADQFIVIYRDTPKDKPLVDYNEGSVLSEKNLDTTAQQAVFAAAEMVDRFDSVNLTNNEAIARSVLALDTANTALDTASDAAADAANAVLVANSASSAAGSATSTANAAAATANGIDGKATQAQADAAAALDAVNGAIENAEHPYFKANGVANGNEAPATVTGYSTVAVGHAAKATKIGATAVGAFAEATKSDATAIGESAKARGDKAIAMGYGANAQQSNSVAIGHNAQSIAINSTAIGYYSLADDINTVSVGNSALKRRIVNVAPGIDATDAATVSQLRPDAYAVGSYVLACYAQDYNNGEPDWPDLITANTNVPGSVLKVVHMPFNVFEDFFDDQVSVSDVAHVALFQNIYLTGGWRAMMPVIGGVSYTSAGLFLRIA